MCFHAPSLMPPIYPPASRTLFTLFAYPLFPEKNNLKKYHCFPSASIIYMTEKQNIYFVNLNVDPSQPQKFVVE